MHPVAAAAERGLVVLQVARLADDISADVVFAIGSDLVGERGFESLRFLDSDPRTTPDDRKFLRSAFAREPVALLRAAVAMRLWAEAHDVDGDAVGCAGGNGATQSQTAKLNIQFTKRSRESVWRFEQGQWRLEAIGGFRPVAAPQPANRAVADKTPSDKPTEKAAKKEDRAKSQSQHRGRRELPRR